MDKRSETCITPEEAKKMVNNYAAVAGKYPDAMNTKAVWFDLAQIKQFMSLIEEAQKQGQNMDGIRFYFGRYDGEFNPSNKDDSGKNTLLFVATCAELVAGRAIHKDCFSYPVGLEGLISDIPPENRGEMCPNMCDGTEL